LDIRGHGLLCSALIIRATRVTLRDGTRVIVRAVRKEDGRSADAFFNWLSEETRYLRFMYQAKELTPAMMRGALAQDELRRVSLVVEPIVQADGDPPAIALGRYAPTDDPFECEVAITVGDAWQRRGVGGVLLKRLIALAVRGGYRSMSASVLSVNAKMIGLARAFGFSITERSNGVTVMTKPFVGDDSGDHIPG
jgi:acetyltransferase